MSQSPHRGATVFEEATLRFFRVPASEVEYEDDNNENSEDQLGTVRSLKKNLDLISLIACRRQGVLPQQLGMAQRSSGSHSSSRRASSNAGGSPHSTKNGGGGGGGAGGMSWAEKQHRLGLLRVLTLERARVVSEMHEVLKRDHDDPHARQRMSFEIKLVSQEASGGSGAGSPKRRNNNDSAMNDGDDGADENDDDELPFFVADPEEAELVSELISERGNHATTAAIQERLLGAVKRRSEKALARMMRQHDRVITNEKETHAKRVEMLNYLHERDAVREKQQKERKKELQQRAAEQAQLREEKMKTLKLRFAVINNQRKEELLAKQRASEEQQDRAQQKQIEQLVQRCAAEHTKILQVQDRVAHTKMEEERRREQMEAERAQRSSVTAERRSALELSRDYRLEKRKQRHELQQMRAQQLREQRQEEMRESFDAAHKDQLVSTHDAVKQAHSNKDIIAHRRGSSSSRNATPAAAAASRPMSKQRSERSGAAGGDSATPVRAHSRTEDRHKAEREEVLRRFIELKAKEQREQEILEQRTVEAEAARRLRQRDEEMRKLHNAENLARKERADAHRHQLQQQLVEEQAAAAAAREREKLRAEKKLQMLKLDLQRQREEAQEEIRSSETKAHMKQHDMFEEDSDSLKQLRRDTESTKARKAANSDGDGGDGSGSDTEGRKKPVATVENSQIMQVIAGHKLDRGKRRAQY